VEFVTSEAVAATEEWIAAVLRGDFDSMWRATDENLRLCEAQLWLHANRKGLVQEGYGDLRPVATELAQLQSDHPLRREFESLRVSANRQIIPDGFGDGWGLATARRQPGPDLEIVLYVHQSVPDAGHMVTQQKLLDGSVALLFLTRRQGDGSCVVAGFDYNAPVPGWPPQSGVPVDIVDNR
jgi:hypothetical protein